jgi:hypothetical protein
VLHALNILTLRPNAGSTVRQLRLHLLQLSRQSLLPGRELGVEGSAFLFPLCPALLLSAVPFGPAGGVSV